jgi:hypothetical protein
MMSKKNVARTKRSTMYGDRRVLECALCKENDREELLIEDIGISVGLYGEEYCFCADCWKSEDLGEKLLNLLGFPDGIKISDSELELELWEGE